MKYYLCIVGKFKDDGEDQIIKDCLDKNIYQYHVSTHQKGAGKSIEPGDTLILIFNKKLIGYGTADGQLGDLRGYDQTWHAVKIKGEWTQAKNGAKSEVPLPYGVYMHTIIGNMQSVVKEIGSLWANELILQIILSDRQLNLKLQKEPVMYFHLPTIATFLQKDYLKIPPVQRGKVWNATRVEVLWDSIMRNIPIGTIDIKPVQGGWEILDGQQRTNSIAMGYQKLGESQKEQAILWLDIGQINCNKEVQSKIDRKFFFRVTTVAHPWGYKLSNDETKNITLEYWEQKRSVDELDPKLAGSKGGIVEQKTSVEGLNPKWENSKKPGARPYPHELWPWDAVCPIPFTVLRTFFERYPEGTFDNFRTFLNKYKESNWYTHIKDKKIDIDVWESLSVAMSLLNNKVVLAQNSINVADDDIGLYFKRLNKSGIEPDAEEIHYSLLKSKLPELKELDTIAANRMRPSRLANIAMRTYLILKKETWIKSIDHNCIKELSEDTQFQAFIKSDFSQRLEKIESWLLYDKENNSRGIPRILYSQLARRHPDIFCLLIALADSIGNIDNKIMMIAMITLIMWFNQNINIGECYQILKNNPTKTFETNIKTWLFEAINKAQLIIPPPIKIFKDILVAVQTEDLNAVPTEKMANIMKAWSVPAYFEGINKIWHWSFERGRGLLLYVVREYLQKSFGDYDPADAVWNEENRPWDYDHIFPQDWLRSGRGNSCGKFHKIVEKFLHSIGNIAPISFSKNRDKQATPPKKYQGDDNSLLHVDPCDFFIEPHGTALENKPDLAFKFAEITATRLCQLYNSWYTDLNIDNLLNFTEINNARKILFEQIKEKLPGSEIYYTCTGFQYKCSCSSDMARPWIAVGIVRNGPSKDFVSIASDGKIFNIGRRRHPEENSIENDSNKWWYTTYKELPMDTNMDTNVKKIMNELQTLLGEKTEGVL